MLPADTPPARPSQRASERRDHAHLRLAAYFAGHISTSSFTAAAVSASLSRCQRACRLAAPEDSATMIRSRSGPRG